MEATKLIVTIPIIFSILAFSFSITGWIIFCISFLKKISNYTGNKIFLIYPKVYLMFFFGCLTFSLSHIYEKKWIPFAIQFLASGLNLCIYILQSKSFKKRLEEEQK